MSDLSNSTKYKLECLFDMGSGYVLDFSNLSFSDFIQKSISVDVDKKYDGSKAMRLRQLWEQEPNCKVVKLTKEMLERWQTIMLVKGNIISPSDQKLYELCLVEIESLETMNHISKEDALFLSKDFSDIDFSKINIPISFKDIFDQRLKEIEQSLDSKSPLAVIFLCGSTLEGLLFEVASKNIATFNRCVSSPKYKSVVKPLPEWTLDNLITVSRELNLVGQDVVKHAHALKDFRNYIHPRQQIRENFTPRMFTAEMASKVLYAAIADLSDKRARSI